MPSWGLCTNFGATRLRRCDLIGIDIDIDIEKNKIKKSVHVQTLSNDSIIEAVF